MTDGTADLERLVAIEAIEHLKARCDHALDTKDWATYEALHAGHYRSHDDDDDGEEERRGGGAANARRMAARLKDATSVHHSHAPVIAFSSPTGATAVWGLEENIFRIEADGGRAWRQGFGSCHETYEKIDGRWLVTSRSLRRRKVIVTRTPAEG